MTSINVHDAESRLSELLSRAVSGEVIVIAEGGKPIARLVPLEQPARRELGQDRGLFEIPEDFDSPLPEEVLRLFEG